MFTAGIVMTSRMYLASRRLLARFDGLHLGVADDDGRCFRQAVRQVSAERLRASRELRIRHVGVCSVNVVSHI